MSISEFFLPPWRESEPTRPERPQVAMATGTATRRGRRGCSGGAHPLLENTQGRRLGRQSRRQGERQAPGREGGRRAGPASPRRPGQSSWRQQAASLPPSHGEWEGGSHVFPCPLRKTDGTCVDWTLRSPRPGPPTHASPTFPAEPPSTGRRSRPAPRRAPL